MRSITPEGPPLSDSGRRPDCFDLQADWGTSKHLGGLKATRELLERYSHAKHVKLVLNFEGVKQLSSEAIGNLIILNRNLRNRRGIMKLCGQEPDVWSLFLTARLNRVFEIYDTETNAVSSFAKS